METKGCVYFMKHKGLSPIKIGFTTSETPIGRFNDMNIFSPYGCEILGYIVSENPNKLENEIHKLYSNKKIKGEWYELSLDDVNFLIKKYNPEDELRKQSEFYEQYINFIEKEKTIKEVIKNSEFDVYNFKNTAKREFILFRQDYTKNNKINISKVAKRYNVSRVTIYRWIDIIKNNELQRTNKS
jgi:hypothetical protein